MGNKTRQAKTELGRARHRLFFLNKKMNQNRIGRVVHTVASNGRIRRRGKDHLLFLNSGVVKKVRMGSLAGPESPSPCSQRMKLRVIAGSGLGGERMPLRWRREAEMTVAATAAEKRAAGLNRGQTNRSCIYHTPYVVLVCFCDHFRMF
ncbi:hypothetical protein HPP92_004340 [Vanilla planifolia]|uniref:Uncharacterized protein n=1 Tax=Vanilla planifolia TaxID=51239 RepID=A0A835VEE1_VANPL|nr:hypothetical protein HPP92_004340 [Vanilla planifolia]